MYPIAIPIPCPARASACLRVVAPLVLRSIVNFSRLADRSWGGVCPVPPGHPTAPRDRVFHAA
eukprot:scaffold83013_cov60-Phaeocystis_antarctica.AAC.1